jgi:hypothetical protein
MWLPLDFKENFHFNPREDTNSILTITELCVSNINFVFWLQTVLLCRSHGGALRTSTSRAGYQHDLRRTSELNDFRRLSTVQYISLPTYFKCTITFHLSRGLQRTYACIFTVPQWSYLPCPTQLPTFRYTDLRDKSHSDFPY